MHSYLKPNQKGFYPEPVLELKKSDYLKLIDISLAEDHVNNDITTKIIQITRTTIKSF